MSLEENKTIMRKFLEASTGSDSSVLLEFLHPDFVAHLAGGPKNRDEFLQHNNVTGMAFSEKEFVIKDQVAEEDKVTARVVWKGTNTGNFLGNPPTGKQIAISAFVHDRIKDGKVVEHWSLFDQLSMMQQLGILPSPPGVK